MNENQGTATFERGMKYRWVWIVVAVIAGAIAGGADLNPVMLIFLLLLAAVFVLVAMGGQKLFDWAFGARIERRVRQGAHPERVTTGLVAVAVVMVAGLVLTVAGGPALIRTAALLLAAVIFAVSVWSAGRSSG